MIKVDKFRSGNETKYIHICDGLTEKKMREKGIEILISDIHIYTVIFEYKTQEHKVVAIKNCPFCGCDVDKELNEFYK